MAAPAAPRDTEAAEPRIAAPHEGAAMRQQRRRASPVRAALVALLSCLLGVALVVGVVVVWALFGSDGTRRGGDEAPGTAGAVEALEGGSQTLQGTATPPDAAD